MTEIRLGGLSAIETTISASQGDRSGSASGTPNVGTSAPTPPAAFIGRAVNQWSGIGGSGAGTHYAIWTPKFSPTVIGMFFTLQTVDGNIFTSSQMHDLDLRSARAIGGRARIYRIVNGEMVLVRDSVIIDGNWGQWNRLTSAANKGATSGYEYRFETYSRAGGTYWFGVAAVDGSNQIGTIGTASYTPSSLSTGAAPSNTETTLGGNYTTGGSLPAPTNVTATADGSGERTVVLTWDDVAEATGYIPFISWNEEPNDIPTAPWLELEDDGGAVIQAGDFAVLSMPALVPTTDMISQRAWGAESVLNQVDITPFGPSSLLQKNSDLSYAYHPFEEGDESPDLTMTGGHYLRINLASGLTDQALLLDYWHSDATQEYYEVLDPDRTYKFDVWVRSDRAVTGGLTFQFDSSNRIGFSDIVFDLVPGWQKLSTSASPNAFLGTGLNVGRWWIRTSTGAETLQLDFAGAQMTYVGETYAGATAESVALWTPGILIRDDGMVKKRPFAPGMDQLTDAPGQSIVGQTVSGMLRNILANNAKPWLQIEWYHTAEEFQDLVAYLAAPVSSGHPMALKRASQGRADPWTDEWNEIRLEFSNEAWNYISEFWTFPTGLVDSVTATSYNAGKGFGMMCREKALAMMESPYWTSKIKFVIGGWPENSFGADAASTFLLPVSIGPSLYMSGWDVGTDLVQENDVSYQSLLAAAEITVKPAVLDNNTRLQNAATASGGALIFGENLHPLSYESGPGFQLNGLNDAVVSSSQFIQQEIAMRSRACATGVVDAFLLQAVNGFDSSIFFTLGRGDAWKARADEPNGGQTYPTWQLLQIIQGQIGRCNIRDIRNLSVPTINVTNKAGGTTAISTIYAYTLESLDFPGRVMLCVGNRSISDTVKPTICTPWASATGCTVWSNLGDYRQHNRYLPGKRKAVAVTVTGGGQTGTNLTISGLTVLPEVDQTFTIAGVTGVYTVTNIDSWGQTTGTLGITPALNSSPADGAIVTWEGLEDSYLLDPLCVEIEIASQSVSVPANLSRIVIDDSIGAESSGLPPGNCVLIQLDGVT